MIALEEKGAHGPFSNPRDFLDNRFVYVTVSPRAKGLSVGVNLCPDILQTARKRPVGVQSLFAAMDGAEPGVAEIDAYAARLEELVRQGARISLVQIYSATRPMFHPACAHLSLRRLSQIAQTVRVRTRLTVEIF
jgi:hypothetical protein